MELGIYWTEFSQRELNEIYKFYRDWASIRIAKRMINGIFQETLILKSQPQIGQIEELLRNRNQEFRYLIYKNYKIIYWVNLAKKRVEIIDVFDTRQNPIKIDRSKKDL